MRGYFEGLVLGFGLRVYRDNKKTRVNQLLKLTNPGSFNVGIIPCTSPFSYDVSWTKISKEEDT